MLEILIGFVILEIFGVVVAVLEKFERLRNIVMAISLLLMSIVLLYSLGEMSLRYII